MRFVTSIIAAIIAVLLPLTAQADGEKAGDFDYYVLALSWSPTWCALEGEARNSPQCDPAKDYGFVLHGLWPQYEDGWPSFCLTTARDPSRSETAAMEDIMGAPGTAWYQWKKHGRCSGLSPSDFFATARTAFERIKRPSVFARMQKDYRLPASVVEAAFLEVNPSLSRNMITVTCDQRRIQEVRICLTKDLTPRDCAPDTRRDCSLSDALMARIK
ncbi:ribonuclease T2 [Thioclava sp. A2]|uniref:ribonuclease T2 n=1 Tax=Thioclava sp. FCG-A2 TaxID=3080562 RepID=UPI00295372E3|nr:ribonuclease T2 [Thioclava sp. A2]MDV7271519.1 ribonuclease T2 [Thioclava sp. A2]